MQTHARGPKKIQHTEHFHNALGIDEESIKNILFFMKYINLYNLI